MPYHNLASFSLACLKCWGRRREDWEELRGTKFMKICHRVVPCLVMVGLFAKRISLFSTELSWSRESEHRSSILTQLFYRFRESNPKYSNVQANCLNSCEFCRNQSFISVWYDTTFLIHFNTSFSRYQFLNRKLQVLKVINSDLILIQLNTNINNKYK